MSIGLAVVLAVGAVGGWLAFGPGDEEPEPIVVGTTVSPTMVDPAGTYDAGGWALVSNLFQSLMTFEPGGQTPVPDAASQCDFTDHQLTVYRCTLRTGLVFSNGNPVTPEDVKFSYERILAMGERQARDAADESIPEDEKFAYAGPAALLAGLEAVRIDGQDIIFELNQPNATWPFVVASAAGAIVDRASYRELQPRTDGRVVGSGPFLLEAFEPNEYAELIPNPDYDGVARTAEHPVTVRYFVESGGTPGDAKLARAWEEGSIDVNDGDMTPEATARASISGNDDHRVFETVGSTTRMLAFNTDEGMAMSDPVARRAVASLLDREAIARHVQHNTVEPLYSLIPVGFPGQGTPYYDTYEGAEQAGPGELLDRMGDAGLEVPVSFHLAYPGGAASHAEAEMIKEQLEETGLFEVEIGYHDWTTEFIPTVYGSRDYDAYLIGWAPDYPDSSTFMDIVGPADGLATGYSDPHINQLIDDTRAEPDRGAAAGDFRTITELAAEDAPVIPLWQSKQIVVSDASIVGIQNLSDNTGIWRLSELRRL